MLFCLYLCCVADPEWASYTLGVFVCQSCSGLHRNIAQISKVKSILLDPWSSSEVEVRATGCCACTVLKVSSHTHPKQSSSSDFKCPSAASDPPCSALRFTLCLLRRITQVTHLYSAQPERHEAAAGTYNRCLCVRVYGCVC